MMIIIVVVGCFIFFLSHYFLFSPLVLRLSLSVVSLLMGSVCLLVHLEGSRIQWIQSLMGCHLKCCHGHGLEHCKLSVSYMYNGGQLYLLSLLLSLFFSLSSSLSLLLFQFVAIC